MSDSTIADLIRAERKARGVSQARAAEDLGVSGLTFGYWERGVNIPAIRYRARLSRWLQMGSREIGDACLAGLRARAGAPTGPR